MMYVRPSDIYFSQDSIQPYFDIKSLHTSYLIGETLDDLCERRCRIRDIPTISVVQKNWKWFTADNRRLWVFRHLERLGKCNSIPVQTTDYLSPSKFTTVNGGESVRVRGDPGGRWYKRGPSYDIYDWNPSYRTENRDSIVLESRPRRDNYMSNERAGFVTHRETEDGANFCYCLILVIVILVMLFCAITFKY